MPESPSARQRIVAAALDLAARGRWHALSLAEIAQHAGLPLAELVALFPNRVAILDAYADEIDHAMLSTAFAPEEPVPDRLFDVLMQRFEAMAPNRLALAAIARAPGCDPALLVAGLRRLRHALALALETAGLSASGLRGLLRIKGMTAVYLYALRVFLNDDGPDLARTMAALDRALRRADGVARRLGGECPRDTRPPTSADASESDPSASGTNDIMS